MDEHKRKSIAKKYCLSALSLGLKYYPQVFPNPPVGAIIAKDGKIISRGAHERAGMGHAEVNAIHQAGTDAKNADLYISLEPCNHFGKTPPCTKLILEAGIKRVYYLMQDNTPAGGGGEYLREKGVEVYNIDTPPQVSNYLGAWNSYARDQIISLTPFFYLDLGGNFNDREYLWALNKIERRFQKVIREKVDLTELNAYDILFPIKNQRDLKCFSALKESDKVKVSNVVILRAIEYMQNKANINQCIFSETFEHLNLQNVRSYKDMCIEEYEVTNV